MVSEKLEVVSTMKQKGSDSMSNLEYSEVSASTFDVLLDARCPYANLALIY